MFLPGFIKLFIFVNEDFTLIFSINYDERQELS